MSGVLAVIPARLGSTRFPGKALYPYRGRPLIEYVWRAASQASEIDQTIIATDSKEIAAAAKKFGAVVMRTGSRHKTGSDRAAEIARKIPSNIILNIQGDSVGVQPADLNRLVRMMKLHAKISVGTLIYQINSSDELKDTNKVKVVRARDGRALWFSRLPVPFEQKKATTSVEHWGHIGVYAFRANALRQFAAARQSASEISESLEQLRLFELGVPIHTIVTKHAGISIDSPADIQKMDRIAGRQDRKSKHGTR